jgi:hypothetical protein
LNEVFPKLSRYLEQIMIIFGWSNKMLKFSDHTASSCRLYRSASTSSWNGLPEMESSIAQDRSNLNSSQSKFFFGRYAMT